MRDVNVWWSVGLTIGSIIPNDKFNCVRNVTFKDSKMYHPFKGIYVKNNPGVTESMLPGSGGSISDVVYSNIEIN